jgi:general secretion pathway protein N
MLIKSLGVVLTSLLTALVCAPAAWLGDVVQASTPARFIHPRGTIWNGSAILAVSDGQQARVLPGRLSWAVTWRELGVGRLGLTLQQPVLQLSLNIGTDGRSVELSPGEMRLPAALLVALGAPFNTIRPGGTLHARWDAARITPGRVAGLLQVDWEDAQSALSPIAPLGNFRVTMLGRESGAEVALATLHGPLLLQGEGRFENGHGRFTGTARAEPEMAASLMGLIGILGRRVGDHALLQWEL